MCNPRKLAQDVILSRNTSPPAAAAAAVDAGRNYNSTHHVVVADKTAAAVYISSFHLHPEAPSVRWTCAHQLASCPSLWSVRLSVCSSVCLILDMRTQYSSTLSQFISHLRPQLPPLLDGSTYCATLRWFTPVVEYDVTETIALTWWPVDEQNVIR